MNFTTMEEIARKQTETMTIEQLREFAVIGLITGLLIFKRILPEVTKNEK